MTGRLEPLLLQIEQPGEYEQELPWLSEKLEKSSIEFLP